MIYFAQPTNGGPIRIGASQNVNARRRTLGTWIPGGIETILEIEGSFLGEAVLHLCFNPIRVERDWFMSCASIWKFIIEASSARPSWIPAKVGEAPKFDAEAIMEEFGGRDRCVGALGYTSMLMFEQGAKYQTPASFGFAARVLFQRLLREGSLPDFITNLHREALEVAA